MRLLEFCIILLCVVQVGCWSRRRRSLSSETEDAWRRTKRSSEAIGNSKSFIIFGFSSVLPGFYHIPLYSVTLFSIQHGLCFAALCGVDDVKFWQNSQITLAR